MIEVFGYNFFNLSLLIDGFLIFSCLSLIGKLKRGLLKTAPKSNYCKFSGKWSTF